MKYINIFCLVLFTAFQGQAQTMKWVPLPIGATTGKCNCEANKTNQYLCYTLVYTPAVAGILTSYTTGFLASCTSHGSPVVKNASCSMFNNARVLNACEQVGSTLFNSSGHTGTVTNNRVEAGVPVTLHQVCFYIPKGQSITVNEEEFLDLTTSITLEDGSAVTEYPAYVSHTFARPQYDTSLPISWVDFKTVAVGDLVSQLNWSIGGENTGKIIIEHAEDGINFTPIGEVEAGTSDQPISIFQYLDKNAVLGQNYYRLGLPVEEGEMDYSPVRTVYFGEKPFTVEVSPNPATNFLQVDVTGQKSDYEIRIFDLNGKEALLQKAESLTLQTKLNIKFLQSGLYTIQVKCGQELYSEKIMIAERF